MKWGFKTVRGDLLTWRRRSFLPTILRQVGRLTNPINRSSLSNHPKQKVIVGTGRNKDPAHADKLTTMQGSINKMYYIVIQSLKFNAICLSFKLIARPLKGLWKPLNTYWFLKPSHSGIKNVFIVANFPFLHNEFRSLAVCTQTHTSTTAVHKTGLHKVSLSELKRLPEDITSREQKHSKIKLPPCRQLRPLRLYRSDAPYTVCP